MNTFAIAMMVWLSSGWGGVQATEGMLTVVVGDRSYDVTYTTTQPQNAEEFIRSLAEIDRLVLSVPSSMEVGRVRVLEGVAHQAANTVIVEATESGGSDALRITVTVPNVNAEALDRLGGLLSTVSECGVTVPADTPYGRVAELEAQLIRLGAQRVAFERSDALVP